MRARHSGATFNALIRAYTGPIEFEQKRATPARTECRRMLTKAESEFCGMPIAALDDPRVRKDLLDWREKIAKAQRTGRSRQSPVHHLCHADLGG